MPARILDIGLSPRPWLVLGWLAAWSMLVGAGFAPKAGEKLPHVKLCESTLAGLPGGFDQTVIPNLCGHTKVLPGCESVHGQPIYHFDSLTAEPKRKNILVFAIVHGDEKESGSVARHWMHRLTKISSRNSWRIVPVLNPDGYDRNQRMNARGVDLNRNFPSSDWDELAQKWWREKADADPRRDPGKQAASEPETRCAVAHIEAFKPDFIAALHTPYGVLDFDGPDVATPKFPRFPWVSLGTFPGSLGRYMWKDQQVPVLTVELKDEALLSRLDQMDTLQDIAGTVALRAHRKINKNSGKGH